MKARLDQSTGYWSVCRDEVQAQVSMFCPWDSSERRCGSWCPAFRVETRTVKHEGKNATMLGSARWVCLSCFPQPVEYELEESDV
jgi:hypothetical protein